MNQKNSILLNLLACVAFVLFASGCAETQTNKDVAIQFKVVDANTKAPLAGVQGHKYELGHTPATRVNEMNPRPLAPTDASGMVSSPGIAGLNGFRFQQAGYYDARAILHSANSMDVITYEVEGNVIQGSPTQVRSHHQKADPTGVVTVEMYPKR